MTRLLFAAALLVLFFASWIYLPAPNRPLLILGVGAPEVCAWLALAGVAWIGMELFTVRPVGDAMAVTIWGTASSWTLTALPLFIWMGEILFRPRLSEGMLSGLAPGRENLPGRLLRTNISG